MFRQEPKALGTTQTLVFEGSAGVICKSDALQSKRAKKITSRAGSVDQRSLEQRKLDCLQKEFPDVRINLFDVQLS